MFRFRSVTHIAAGRCLPAAAATKTPCKNLVLLSSRQFQTICNLQSVSTVRPEKHCQNDITGRSFASMTEKELSKRLDSFQELFVEARLCIEDCNDSAGTTYFEEEVETATEAVDEAVKAFQAIVDDIEDPDEKNRILRGNGLKVEQLKGELQMALNGGDHHHH